MPKFTVTKIYRDAAVPDGPRTESITGEGNLPAVGEMFMIVGEPLDPALKNNPAAYRVFQTSPVTNIKRLDAFHIILITESGSIYDVVELIPMPL